jgi:outer membrane protein assembly factor BamB
MSPAPPYLAVLQHRSVQLRDCQIFPPTLLALRGKDRTMKASPACRVSLLALVVGFSAVANARGENWPQWRGAKLDGISNESGLPEKWSKSENVAWRFALPGPAGSTPVVWGDRIYLTSADGEDLVLLAVSTQGKQLWRQVMASGNRTIRGDEGNLASPSPSTDGKHVWAMMGSGDLACFTTDGKPVWKLNLQERYGKFDIQFGMASTPVLDGDRLYLQLLHSGDAIVVALDKATGEQIWKQTRSSDARDECEHSYASPVLYRDNQLELLLTHGCDYIVAHRLTDGAEIWRCGGLNPRGKYNPTLRFVASPLAIAGLIIVPSAKNGPVLALDPNSRGDISSSKEGHFWTREHNTPDVPSPLVVDGLVYLCREDGTLMCLDAKTGQEYYLKRTHADRHRASPVYADGKIYLTARDGNVTVVKAGKEFEVLSTNDMSESISASPVISGGRIYLRTFQALYAVGK